MARSRKQLPLTVSRRALLAGGDDVQFRQLIHDLMAYGHRIEACRDAFAGIIGVSGAQYEILMLVSRAEGLSVGEVAARMHRSGAFITIESNRLAQRGLLDKVADPSDGRKVLLKANARTARLIAGLARHQRRINDVLFECLDAKRFAQLRALARELVSCGDRAVAMLEQQQG